MMVSIIAIALGYLIYFGALILWVVHQPPVENPVAPSLAPESERLIAPAITDAQMPIIGGVVRDHAPTPSTRVPRAGRD